ncbi:MAG TPA: hypothetical protein VFZ70_03550 [Euzebyales bacterium]
MAVHRLDLLRTAAPGAQRQLIHWLVVDRTGRRLRARHGPRRLGPAAGGGVVQRRARAVVDLLNAGMARALADRLTRGDMDAGWGMRTVSRDAAAYDALSYHRGSVWPHDTALVVDGIARAGATGAAARLADGVLTAPEHVDWRLPELFGGYDSDEVPTPVPYPTTCDPQAWSAAAPLSLLRTMLRLDPDVPAGTVTIGPALRDDVTLRLTGIHLGDHRLDVTLADGRITARTDPPLAVTVRL